MTRPGPTLLTPGALVAVAGNKTLTFADLATVQNVTAVATLTLPDAATVGTGWWTEVRRAPLATGVNATIVPAGADTMEYGSDAGLVSLLLASDGDVLQFTSTGAGWIVTGDLLVQFIGYADWPTPVAAAITTATLTTIEWDNINTDTHSAFDAGTEEWTVPLSGVYAIDLAVGWQLGSAHAYATSLYMLQDGAVILKDTDHINADDAYGSYQSQQLSSVGRWDKDVVLKAQVKHLYGANQDVHHADSSANENIWRITRLGNRL